MPAYDWSLCLACQQPGEQDKWGYCLDCSWDMQAAYEDEAVVPNLSDLAFDLEAIVEALEDLGHRQIAGMVKPAIRAIDNLLFDEPKQSKQTAVIIKKPVVVTMRALARGKEA